MDLTEAKAAAVGSKTAYQAGDLETAARLLASVREYAAGVGKDINTVEQAGDGAVYLEGVELSA